MQTPAKIKWPIFTIATLGAIVPFAILFFFSPEQFHFYPTCPLYSWTGLQCPACGGLRATHCLLHGEIRRAFAFNPLFVSLIPVAMFWASGQIASVLGRRNFAQLLYRPVVGWCLMAGVIIFAILRNLTNLYGR